MSSFKSLRLAIYTIVICPIFDEVYFFFDHGQHIFVLFISLFVWRVSILTKARNLWILVSDYLCQSDEFFSILIIFQFLLIYYLSCASWFFISIEPFLECFVLNYIRGLLFVFLLEHESWWFKVVEVFVLGHIIILLTEFDK